MNKFLLTVCTLLFSAVSPIISQTLNINDSLTPAELTDQLIIEEDNTDATYVPGDSNSSQSKTGVNGNIAFFEASGNSSFFLNNGVILSTNQASQAAASTIGPAGGGNSSYQFTFVALQENIIIPFVFASDEYAGSQVCTSTEGVTFNINGTGVTGTPSENTVLRVQDVREEQTLPACPASRASEIAGGQGSGNPFPFFARYTTTQTIPLTTTIGEIYTVNVLLNATDSSLDSAVFISSFDNELDFNLPTDFTTCTASEMIAGPTEFQIASIVWSGTGPFTQSGRDITITDSGTYTLTITVAGISRSKSVTLTFQDIINAPASNISTCAPTGSTTATFMLPTGSDYFTSRTAAESDTGTPIANPNSFNGTDGQVIFSRVINPDGCKVISEVTLNIQAGNSLPTGSRIFDLCDSELISSGSVIDADGIESVDYNEVTVNFFSGISGSFEYFDDISLTTSARTGFSASDNGTSTNQIFVTNLATSGCRSNAVPINIRIQLPPTGIPNDDIEGDLAIFDDIIVCDEDDVLPPLGTPDDKDGIATFNLNEIITKINAGGTTGIDISIHPSVIEAESGSNEIIGISNFRNTIINEQRVAARITRTGGDCPIIRLVSLKARHLITDSNLDNNTRAVDILLCDNSANDSDPRNGFATFDLSNTRVDILNFDSIGFTAEIYLNQTNFDLDIPLTNAELASFTNTTINQQSLIIGIRDNDPVCRDQGTLNLIVGSEVILTDIPTSKAPFARCDNDADGVVDNFVQHFQVVVKAEITTDPDLNFFIFTSLTAAQDPANSGALDNTYTNTASATAIEFFAKGISDDGCFDITSYRVIINPAPNTTVPDTIFVCYDRSGSIPNQIVNQRQNQVIPPAQQGQFNFDYYTTLASANESPKTTDNLIANPFAAFDIAFATENDASSDAIVWVRIENKSTGCPVVIPQRFIINTEPIVVNALSRPVADRVNIDFLLCIDPAATLEADFDLQSRDVSILDGQVGKIISYYTDAPAAQRKETDPTAGFIPKNILFPSDIPERTVFFRIENDDDENCFDTGSFALKIARNTATNTAPNIAVCDDDNLDGSGIIDPSDIGFTIFDLQVAVDVITNGGTISGLNIDFFATATDAGFTTSSTVEVPDAPGIPLPRIYKNVTPLSQEIFARITNTNNCTTFQRFFLAVRERPIADPIPELSACDIDSDNRENIDLTTIESSFTFSSNIRPPSPSEITVQYFRTESDRDTHDPKTSPKNLSGTLIRNFQVTAENTAVFIKIIVTNTGCSFDTDFNIKLNTLPTITPKSIVICEDTFGSNQFEIKDVTTLNTSYEFVDTTDSSLSLSYFSDAAATIPITSNFAKTNAINSIFASVMDSNTGCTSRIISIPLIARSLPDLTTPTLLQATDCDDDITPNNGQKVIDFNSKFNAIILEKEIAKGRTTTEYTLQYFDSANVLLNETSEISTGMYRVSVTEKAVLTTDPTCNNIISFQFTLNDIPTATAPEAGIVSRCDVNQDGIIDINLNNFDTTVKGSQTAPEYIVTYHTSEANAISGLEIPENTANLSQLSNGTYYAKITNTNVNCFEVIAFELQITLPPDLTIENTILICENASGSNQISDDLNNYFSSTNVNLEYSYFFVNGETNPIPANEIINGILTNQMATDIFVVLTDVSDPLRCAATKQISISPKRIPTIGIPPVNLRTFCDKLDSSGTVGSDRDNMTVFDFKVELDNAILNGRSLSDYDIRYFDSSNTEVLINSIISTGDYTATITEKVPPLSAPACSNTTAPFSISINPIPLAIAPLDMFLCDEDSTQDGIVDFDITAQTDLTNIILGTESPADFEVTYHTSIEDAERNIIADDFTRNQISTNIYLAKIKDRLTPCFTTVTFNVTVNILPVINILSSPPEFCIGETFADRRQRLIRAYAPKVDQVTFHTGASATASNEIQDTDITPTNIFVKVVNRFDNGVTITECENIREIILQPVNPPIIDVARIRSEARATCDNLDGINDGLATFDFTFTRDDIQNMQIDPTKELAITFHTTADNALNNISIGSNQPLSSGEYFVKVISVSAGCRNIVSINLDIESPPENLLEDIIVFCTNDPSRQINAEITVPGKVFTYRWEFFDEIGNTTRTAETNSSINLSPSDIGTNVRLTVTDNTSETNCNSVRIAKIEEATSPIVNPIAITNFESDEIEIRVPEPGEYLYSLVDFGAEPNIDNTQESNVFQDLLPGKFTVYVFNKKGCDPTRIDVPFINYLPAFTPNGSGPEISETWHIIGVEEIPQTLVYVYSRFGKLLKTLTSKSAGWDGTYNGIPLPSDDYWVLIKLADGQEIKDHITLKR